MQSQAKPDGSSHVSGAPSCVTHKLVFAHSRAPAWFWTWQTGGSSCTRVTRSGSIHLEMEVVSGHDSVTVRYPESTSSVHLPRQTVHCNTAGTKQSNQRFAACSADAAVIPDLRCRASPKVLLSSAVCMQSGRSESGAQGPASDSTAACHMVQPAKICDGCTATWCDRSKGTEPSQLSHEVCRWLWL